MEKGSKNSLKNDKPIVVIGTNVLIRYFRKEMKLLEHIQKVFKNDYTYNRLDDQND